MLYFRFPKVSQYNCSIQILLLYFSLFLLIIRYSQTGYNILPPLIKENEVRSFLIITLFLYNVISSRTIVYVYNLILYNLYFIIIFIFPFITYINLTFITYLNFSISLPR